jgi:hypothetical protein
VSIKIGATTHEGTETVISIDRNPDHCPICHSGIRPLNQGFVHLKEHEKLEIVYRCPREECQSFFIARYSLRQARDYSEYFQHFGSFPFEPFDSEFSEHVAKISPQFCNIMNQALKAEQQDWKLIAGPGYRKALEFLIKDCLCLTRPNDVEQIKENQLGPCIAQFVENANIKATAVRAAWLGNDETHYKRKWEDKDLDDLKTLISLTVHWIEMEEMTASVIKGMPQGKK